jgi:acyl-CoA thioesterase-2
VEDDGVEGAMADSGDGRVVVPGGLFPLERVGPHRFRAPGRAAAERAFGGAVVAQALFAAGGTVEPERRVHSLHGHFLRPGDTSTVTTFGVETVRDGGTYATRRVVAEQRDRAIFALTASFQLPEDGWEHQVPALDAPGPEGLPGTEDAIAASDGRLRQWFENFHRRHPFDLRFAEELPRFAAARGVGAPPRQRFWLRCREPLPDEPLVHSCVAAYASDMLLLSTSLAPHATMIGAPDVMSASLDHAVWFHGPVRADDWLFVDQDSSWAAGGRALCHARMFDRSGALVLSVVQEGVIRRRAASGA